MKLIYKKRFLRPIFGGLIGGVLIFIILYGRSVGLFRNAIGNLICIPFFFISYPAFFVGEAIFGQAPIPVFIIAIIYWILLGAVVSTAIPIIKHYFLNNRKNHG